MATTRESLGHVLTDTPKHLILYGGLGYLAGWLGPRIWWASVTVFAIFAIVVLVDAAQHLLLLVTLPAQAFKRGELTSDAAADTLATLIRVFESAVLIMLGYLTFLKLSDAA